MKLLQFTSEDITQEWKDDSVVIINRDRTIRSESLRIHNLHHKYLTYLSQINKATNVLEKGYANLSKNKTLYYSGILTSEEIKELGWKLNPFGDGVATPKTKERLKIYYDADDDLLEFDSELKELKSMREITLIILKMFEGSTFFFNLQKDT